MIVAITPSVRNGVDLPETDSPLAPGLSVGCRVAEDNKI